MGLLNLMGDPDFNPRVELFNQGEIGVIGDIGDMNRTKLNWRRNLLTYTREYSNAVWGKAAVSVTANSTLAPDGTLTADTITEDGTTDRHRLSCNVAHTAGQVYTLSVEAKLGTGSRFLIINANTAISALSAFNLSTGAVHSTTSGTASITDLGDGWYRCSVTGTAATTATTTIYLQLDDNGVDGTYAGDGASSLIFGGSQFELGSLSEYQPILDGATNFKLAFPNHALYQDSNGVTPVTAVGDLVGLAIDKSQGGLDALGPELLSDTGFDDAGEWETNAGVTISSGTAVWNTAGTSVYVRQPSIITANRWYLVEIDCTAYTSGTLYFAYADGGTTVTQVAINSVKNHRFVVQSTAGGGRAWIITPAGGAVATISRFSVREIPGHSIYQATSGSRPALSRVPFGGRRNLLNESERFDQAFWTKDNSATVTANTTANKNGDLIADTVTAGTTGTFRQIRALVGLTSGTQRTFSCYLKAGTSSVAYLVATDMIAHADGRYFDLSSGTKGGQTGLTVGTNVTLNDSTITSEGDGWYRCTITVTVSATTTFSFLIGIADANNSVTSTAGKTIIVDRAQLDAGSTATNYQRTQIAGTVVDCTESGVPDCWYLDTSSNKWMQTAAIDFSGTDEMTVIAGVRKLSDAARGIVVELTTVATNPGSFYVGAPDTNGVSNYGFYFDTGNYYQPTTYTAPITNVVSAIFDRSASSLAEKVISRLNGVVNQTNGGPLAPSSGNFANASIYIGARGGASLYFNGHIFQLIIRGKTTSGSKLTRAEKYIAKKTGLTI